jgi:hypothetical protein
MSRSDQRRLLLDCILEKLLRGCESTDAALVTRGALPRGKGPLPERLEQFLDGYIKRPAERAVDEVAMRAAMADFGTRVFRHLLATGMNREDCETDLAQNTHDVLAAANLLRMLAAECHHTAFLPRATGELLSRTANALYEVRSNSRPALFDGFGGAHHLTPGHECEGRLAAALEIVIRGGMKLAAAERWLEAEMRKAGLVDEAGNQISGERVRFWRNNFRGEIGARGAHTCYDEELADHVLTAPNDELKLAACQDLAHRLVRMLAHLFNRTVSSPPVKIHKRRTAKKY